MERRQFQHERLENEAFCNRKDGNDIEQRLYYDEGVAGVRGGGFGKGLGKNILQAYQWVVENFEAGDEIFIFGFSRGAFTARSVAGFIAKYGVVSAGGPLGIGQLYARYQQPLLSYLRLLTSDAGLAEELLQDTLLAAWTGARGFAGRASVQGWLFGIARRRAHDTLRRRALRLVDGSEFETTASSEPTPEDLLLAEAERSELVAAITRLGAIHQEILVLTFVHELAYKDLAEVLGIPIGTVKSRLNNAKRALREQLLSEAGHP